MKKLFYKPQIDRLEFLVNYILSLAVMIVGIFSTDSPKASFIWLVSASTLFVCAVAYMVFFAVVPRLVSAGLSRWFGLLLLIPPIYPIIFLFLVFCPAGHFAKNDTAT
jgi:uncharacterized membrane protein YhaH (DUF805 family)